jgi:L-asparagine oxygenase
MFNINKYNLKKSKMKMISTPPKKGANREKFVAKTINNVFAPDSEEVPRPMVPQRIIVTPRERQQIDDLGRHLIKLYGHYNNSLFVAALYMHAFQDMPKRLIKILSAFASDFSYHQFGALVFVGLVTVDQDELGPTPKTYKEADPAKTVAYGFISMLMHALVRGFPIMQQQQREGKKGGLLHPIIPNPDMAATQTGEGTVELAVHTEDPYLYSAARFISMMFLRNFEQAPSMLYSIRSHDLTKSYVDDLFKKIYLFPLDDNFPEEIKNKYKTTEAVLWGNKTLPFLRYDPVEQLRKNAGQTPEAFNTLQQFEADAKLMIYQGYIPQAGDFVMINNLLCCHGRGSFEAGVTLVDGVKVPCEKRFMLRMMSAGSAIDNFQYTHEQTHNLVIEKHFGQQ